MRDFSSQRPRLMVQDLTLPAWPMRFERTTQRTTRSVTCCLKHARLPKTSTLSQQDVLFADVQHKDRKMTKHSNFRCGKHLEPGTIRESFAPEGGFSGKHHFGFRYCWWPLHPIALRGAPKAPMYHWPAPTHVTSSDSSTPLGTLTRPPLTAPPCRRARV